MGKALNMYVILSHSWDVIEVIGCYRKSLLGCHDIQYSFNGGSNSGAVG